MGADSLMPTMGNPSVTIGSFTGITVTLSSLPMIQAYLTIDPAYSPTVIAIAGAASTQSAALAAGWWWVTPTLDVCVLPGTNPTATTSSHYVPAGCSRLFYVAAANDKIAAIRLVAATGTVYLSRGGISL